MKNLIGMKRLMAEYSMNTTIDPLASVFLGFGQTHLEDMLRLPEMEKVLTGTLSASSQSLNLPGDYLEFRYLLLIDSGGNRYTFDNSDYREINDMLLVKSTDIGVPGEIAHFGNTLYFNRYTDREFTFALGYYRRLPNFGDTLVQTPTSDAAATGTGTLTAGTYYYRVSAFNGWGETLAFTQVSKTLSVTGGVLVKWETVQGAVGYKVYGRSNGAQLYMATVYHCGNSYFGENTVSWLDDGSITPVGALPSANTTVPGDNTSNTWSEKYEEALLLSALVKACSFLINEPREKTWTEKRDVEIQRISNNLFRALPHDSTLHDRGSRSQPASRIKVL